MKKIMAVLAFALTGVATVSAQSYDYPRFHMGLRVGMSSTSNSFSSNYDGEKPESKSLNTPYGGLALDFRVAHAPLYLETGVYYMDKGAEYEANDGYTSDSRRALSINMPLLLSYHYYLSEKVAVQPFAGVVGGYLTDVDKGFTGAARVGCGINYGRLYANVGYDIGLTSHEMDRYEWDFYGCDRKMNTLFVTIGFNFIGAGR